MVPQNPKSGQAFTAEQQELLAYLLAEEGINSTPPQTIPVREAQHQPPPLSYQQERTWLLDQLEPGSQYNDYYALRLQGTLARNALARAVNTIVARHDILRTTIALVDDEPVQVVAPALQLPLTYVDVRSYPVSERETHARQVLAEAVQQPFDLSLGPLLRVVLVQVADDDYIFLRNIHQMVNDTWSLGLFLKELTALYNAYVADATPDLPELRVQYGDYAQWQRKWLEGEMLETQLDYWTAQLADAPPVLALPTDYPRPAAQTFDGARCPIEFAPPLIDALRTLSAREGVTLFMTLTAAFSTLLYRYTGQEDVLLGAPIANRGQIELEDLIGMFINTLVLRVDVSGNPTFAELLARTRDVVTDAMIHPDLPFEKLVEELQPARNLDHTPIFQVMFDYQNTPTPTVQFAGLTASPFAVDSGTAKFDLTLDLVETAESLHGYLEYNTALFAPDTIERMARNLQTLLSSVAANSAPRLSDLAVIAPRERQKLLTEWNQTQADYDQDLSIYQLFERQATTSPAAIAVVFGDEELSYEMLNQRANQLAHHLRTLAVGPGTFVGLCVERSLDMLVGLLGVMKAGGVYLPLDPALPAGAHRLHAGRCAGRGAVDPRVAGGQLAQVSWADGVAGSGVANHCRAADDESGFVQQQ